MQRRNFLGLLAGAAAAIALPEQPSTRSYFFGPWKPRESGLVTVTEEWDAERYRWLVDAVEKRYLPRSTAEDLLGIERAAFPETTAAQFIPEIWSADVHKALQARSVLADRIDTAAMYDIQTMGWRLRVATGDQLLELLVEDLPKVQASRQLRGHYASAIAYALVHDVQPFEQEAA